MPPCPKLYPTFAGLVARVAAYCLSAANAGEVRVGARVLRAVAAPGGGALLQTGAGALLAWRAGAGLAACGPGACFGEPCPLMRATPAAALGAPGDPSCWPPGIGLHAMPASLPDR